MEVSVKYWQPRPVLLIIRDVMSVPPDTHPQPLEYTQHIQQSFIHPDLASKATKADAPRKSHALRTHEKYILKKKKERKPTKDSHDFSPSPASSR